MFKNKLSKSYNYIQWDSVLISNSEQYKSPTKTLFPILSPSKNTQSVSNENINIFTEDTTIYT